MDEPPVPNPARPPAGKDGRKGWGCLAWGLLVGTVLLLAFCGITVWALMNADFR